MPFSYPGLSAGLCRAADELGYKELSPIQAESIPVIFEGKDLAAASQTGSGKTAAFLFPILHCLSEKKQVKKSALKVLILVPTRELAVQVADNAKILSRYLPRVIRITAVHGGVSINPQMKSLIAGTDILVATPGRLVELVFKKAVNLVSVETLVIDEADKMLDLGFKEEIGTIIGMLPAKRQNLLFSATLKRSIELPEMDFIVNAVKIGIGADEKPPEPVEQIVYKVAQDKKGLLLRHLINDGEWSRVLVFVSSKRKADNVTRKLSVNNISAELLHGDKSQGARTGALIRFKQGKTRVLVATDIASRGIDIDLLPYVVNYELPRSAGEYIHRVGRTGRAGMKGIAVTLLSEEDYPLMKLIEKRYGIKPVYIDSDEIRLS